jgi:prepilin-type N-terminal cleavage/methylation domain-containing protein
MITFIKKYYQQQDGYTLIETIIAMALFLSVLIPLIGTMGNMMFDKKSQRMNTALSLAVTEMNVVADAKDFTDRTSSSNGLIVERSIQKSIPIIEVKVTVQTEGEQAKEILTLRRTFLVY